MLNRTGQKSRGGVGGVGGDSEIRTSEWSTSLPGLMLKRPEGDNVSRLRPDREAPRNEAPRTRSVPGSAGGRCWAGPLSEPWSCGNHLEAQLQGGRIPCGQQHSTLVSIAGTLRARLVCDEAIETCLQIINTRQRERPGPAENIARIVRSSRRWVMSWTQNFWLRPAA